MLILTVRTDNPDAEIGLYDGQKHSAYKKWYAHRELSVTIHKVIQELLDQTGNNWHSIEAVAVYKGPGSFTGLRIGITVADTVAYSLGVPIAGGSGEDWIEKTIAGLLQGVNEQITLPEYGAEAHITLPKK
jgi:tRNA threonylcarbamoyladenosine biosynthesis protein TsaB